MKPVRLTCTSSVAAPIQFAISKDDLSEHSPHFRILLKPDSESCIWMERCSHDFCKPCEPSPAVWREAAVWVWSLWWLYLCFEWVCGSLIFEFYPLPALKSNVLFRLLLVHPVVLGGLDVVDIGSWFTLPMRLPNYATFLWFLSFFLAVGLAYLNIPTGNEREKYDVTVPAIVALPAPLMVLTGCVHPTI